MTATLFVIRHAEKPLGDGPPHAVDSDGNPDAGSLTPKGWQRAGALAALFGDAARAACSPGGLVVPTRLFAPAVHAGDASRRPLETLAPLADRLGIVVDTRFGKDQVGDLARAVLAIDGTALIAWEHHLIPALAARILGTDAGIPAAWPDDCFDVTWAFEPVAGGGHTFRQIPQRLLAGDRAQ
jgi:hypothetical protein